MENREGRLDDVLNLLKENNVNIISLSLADSTDYGMLRLIVNDPEKAQAALKSAGFSAKISEVVGVKMSHTVGSLQGALSVFTKNHINIEYMYALCTKTDEAAIVIMPADIERAVEELKKAGYDLFTDGDLF